MLSLTDYERAFWYREARRKEARRRRDLLQGGSVAYMQNEDRERLVESIQRDIEDDFEMSGQRMKQAAREAEWAANRRQLRGILGGSK